MFLNIFDEEKMRQKIYIDTSGTGCHFDERFAVLLTELNITPKRVSKILYWPLKIKIA